MKSNATTYQTVLGPVDVYALGTHPETWAVRRVAGLGVGMGFIYRFGSRFEASNTQTTYGSLEDAVQGMAARVAIDNAHRIGTDEAMSWAMDRIYPQVPA